MKATTTYYIAIGVYLVCLVIIVVKMTFWPVSVCTSASTTCDGWTIAGLTAAILGVTAAFLAILGAVFFAAWWTGLDKRVEDRVAEAFDKRIQSVKSTIDQLDTQINTVQDSLTQLSTQAVALQNKADNLEAFVQKQDEQEREQAKQIQSSINELQTQANSLKNMIESIAQDIQHLTFQTQAAQSTASLALQETLPPYMQTMADHSKAKQQEQEE